MVAQRLTGGSKVCLKNSLDLHKLELLAQLVKTQEESVQKLHEILQRERKRSNDKWGCGGRKPLFLLAYPLKCRLNPDIRKCHTHVYPGGGQPLFRRALQCGPG